MKKILITGANGFLGSKLLNRFQSKGKNVSVLINKNQDNIPKGIDMYTFDSICNCPISFDTIFHLGAFIPSRSDTDNNFIDLNVTKTEMLTKLYPDAHWVYSSSVSLYEHCLAEINENTTLNFSSEYAISKYKSEKIITNLQRYKILRFSSLYGEGMRSDSIIPFYIKKAVNESKIPIYGNGDRLQDYIYVEDALNYLERSLEAPNGIYLAVTGVSVSNSVLGNLIAKKYMAEVIYLPHYDEGNSYVYNNKKTKVALGINELTTLEEGLKLII